MRFLIFVSLFLTVFILLNLYISKRLIDKLDIDKKHKWYFYIFLILNFIGMVGYMFARYNPAVPNWLYFLLSLPIGVIFLLFCTAVIYDIFRVVIDRVPINEKRRSFFKKTLDIASLTAAIGLSGKSLHEASVVETQRVEVKIAGLKRDFKIVQLSDIHIGGLIDHGFIKDMVKRVNALEPDLVVITGDMVDISLEYAKPALNELKTLRSRYGTFFVAGNHEYFHGVEEIIKEVENLGIKVLKNESVFIGDSSGGFNLAGVYDVMGYRMGSHEPDLKKALENIKDAPVVLLAHQPKFAHEVKGVDLMLSGHTHGGQLYPFRYLVGLAQPYISGLNRHDERLQVYVNKGTGFWGPPMRLGASSEITLLTIRADLV